MSKDKPNGKSAGKPATKPTAKPVGKSTAKPAAKPATNTAGKPTAKPTAGSRRAAVKPATGLLAAAKKQRRRDVQKGLAERTGGIMPGDHTIKVSPELGGLRVTTVRPKFNEGSLIFRPYPTWDLDHFEATGDLVVADYRQSRDNNMLSDFVRCYPAAFCVGEGDNMTTFLLFDKDWDETTYDRQSNPYLLLYKTVKREVNTHGRPEWAKLIKGSPKKPALLSAPCDLYFFQGFILKNGKDKYFGEPGQRPAGLGKKDPVQIIVLKNTAGSTLLEAMNAVNDEWTGDPNDFENSMTAGDPVNTEGGRFFMVYNPDVELNRPGVDPSKVTLEYEDESGNVSARSQTNFKSYATSIVKHPVIGGVEYSKISPAISDAYWENVVSQRIIFWDSLIHLPSNEEQALYLARALSSFRSVLEYAWQGHPEFLTEDVRKVLKNAKQVSLAGSAALEPAASTSLTMDDEDEYPGSEEVATTADEDEYADSGYADDEGDEIDDSDDGIDEEVDEEVYDDDVEEEAEEEAEEDGEEVYDDDAEEEVEGAAEEEDEVDEDGEEVYDDDAEEEAEEDAESEDEAEYETSDEDDAEAALAAAAAAQASQRSRQRRAPAAAATKPTAKSGTKPAAGKKPTKK